MAPELPEDVVAEAERLTRAAREAVDPNEREAAIARRADILAEYDYDARVRDDDTMVCYPLDWFDETGVVRTDRIDDLSLAIEVPLGTHTGDEADWGRVEAHNRAVAEQVAEAHGPTHGATAHAFADFMGNHYALPIEEATPVIREEFVEEYFPRNAWPNEEQQALVEETLSLVDAVTKEG